MFTFAIRGLAAAAAAAALIGAWLYNQVSSTAAADLGAVLTRTSAAKSLELKVTQDGKTRRGLGPRPETPPQPARRHLPDRPRRQVVARRREGESGQPATCRRCSAARPAAWTCWPCSIFPRTILATSRRNCWRPGRPSTRPATAATLEIYRWETAGPDGTLRIEAVVDAKTQLLQSIESLRVRGERTEPICKLAVIARDKPVDEDLFVVGDTLTEDGRIGKVTDAQGLVAIRPGDARSLQPGDRADADPPRRLAADRSARGQRRLGPPGSPDRTGDRAGQHGRTGFAQAASHRRGRDQDQGRGQVAHRSSSGRTARRSRSRARKSTGPTGRRWSSWTSRPAGS